MKIKKFIEFDSINESSVINLSEEEKRYFWSKIEYSKKKKAIDSKNELYNILTSNGDSKISKENMISFLNSLEYSIKKQMKDENKVFKNEIASSLKSKIPNDWIGIKYSSLTSKRNRDSNKNNDN